MVCIQYQLNNLSPATLAQFCPLFLTILTRCISFILRINEIQPNELNNFLFLLTFNIALRLHYCKTLSTSISWSILSILFSVILYQGKSFQFFLEGPFVTDLKSQI